DCTPDARPPVGSWYAARASTGASLEAWYNSLWTAWATAAAVATAGTDWNDPEWERRMYEAWVLNNREIADRWEDFFWEGPSELGFDDFTDFPGWVTERVQQASFLRELIGNPFRAP